MTPHSSAGFMLGLDLLMIVYTLWVLSLSATPSRLLARIGVGMLVWLGLLHGLLTTGSLFPEAIGGVAFLLLIFVGVGAAGALLLGVPILRATLMGLSQQQLLLLQGVRVFFGATFLMQAATGILPRGFGILDGYTHIGAGFFGLVAAFCVATGTAGRQRAWFANLFGLADILVVASTLALLLLPEIGPHHSMMYAVFLPAPLWLWFHVISMIQLVREERTDSREATA